MDHGDGNMQRWKRAATPDQLRLALQGAVESMNHHAKEGFDICVRLSTKEGCESSGTLGSDYFIKIMQALIWIDDLVLDLELAEARLTQ